MIVLFDFAVLIMILYEYNRVKTLISPFCLLASIYLILVPFVNFVCVHIGFNKLNDVTIGYFFIYLFILFLSGSFFRLQIGRKVVNNTNNIEQKLLKSQNIITLLYIIGLVGYLINLLQVISIYGILNAKSNGFGIFAHIGYISRSLLPIIIYYAYKTKKNKYILMTITNVVALIIFGGKYHIIAAILPGLLIILTINRNYNILKLIKYSIILLLAISIIFISVYAVFPRIATNNLTWNGVVKGSEFAIQHMLFYVVCPLIDSNVFFQNPVYIGMSDGYKVVFNQFQHLYEAFIGQGNYYPPEIMIKGIVNSIGDGGNVGGIFSETVLHIGYLDTGIYVFIIGLIVYHFFSLAYRHQRYILTAMFLTSLMMMSFFCNFFSLYGNFESFVICFLTDLFFLDKRIRTVKLKKLRFETRFNGR